MTSVKDMAMSWLRKLRLRAMKESVQKVRSWAQIEVYTGNRLLTPLAWVSSWAVSGSCILLRASEVKGDFPAFGEEILSEGRGETLGHCPNSAIAGELGLWGPYRGFRGTESELR